MHLDGPALVVGDRGAGEAQADAPLVGHRHQDEREQPAGQRLGLVAEALVDAATALVAEKYAAIVLAVVQAMTPRLARAVLDERLQAAQVGVLVPALGENALPFFFRDRDLIFLTTGAANVAVPVLEHWEMIDR